MSKVIKKKLRGFLQRFLQEIMKKIMHGTLDTWLMGQSSHQPSILYWRLSDFKFCSSFFQNMWWQLTHPLVLLTLPKVDHLCFTANKKELPLFTLNLTWNSNIQLKLIQSRRKGHCGGLQELRSYFSWR